MAGIYARWMDNWERKLATRDTNRVVRPFEWGTDWLNRCGFPACPAEANGNSKECVSGFVSGALEESDRFFAHAPVTDFELRGSRLTFTSPVPTPYPENNTAHALWFQAPKDRGGRSSCCRNGTPGRMATWDWRSSSTGSGSAPCA